MIHRPHGHSAITILRRGVSAATLIPATLMLAACASGGTSAPAGALPQSQPSRSVPESRLPNSCTSRSTKHLYVANFGHNDVLVFCNEYYVKVGRITSGVSEPSDVSLDRNGNLYVANFTTVATGAFRNTRRAISVQRVSPTAPGWKDPKPLLWTLTEMYSRAIKQTTRSTNIRKESIAYSQAVLSGATYQVSRSTRAAMYSFIFPRQRAQYFCGRIQGWPRWV